MTIRISFLLLSLLVLAGARAHATPTFPEVVNTKLALTTAVSCTLCHTDPGGGAGNVTQPIGVSLFARGMVPYDEASLQTAVDKLTTDAVDSDTDGATDIDELKAGTDPNAASTDDSEPISYGFGCAQTGTTTSFALALLLLLQHRRRPR
jgi:hypothetical protein